MNRDEFIGKGWKFPVGFSEYGAMLDIAVCNQDIQQSLLLLLTTIPGERIAHPLFGCDLNQYMFRSISNSLLSDIKQTILTAITLFEVRIQVLQIMVNRSVSQSVTLEIAINYQLNHTNSRYNLVIPFNLIDGFQIS
ncbi:hypothetical protein PRUB_a0088 [Pseudoalteromonas rubra]|uniref:IraD/Gp25-like domain-containing protein n=1 Tax=Pseudoalteromonas rubra TaxID=43658 RepID=A0A8T0C6Q2_9GAMM|nr:GPW/gp25 family protein [Pseudoalteromonas rubra]KAF7785722.1 hypothetical protein PRUB_a0088 [Pseudoalteromonas rubra]